MRISHETMVDQSLRRLQTRLQGFQDTQVRLGTGRRFQVASEDVSGMNVSLTLRAELRALEQARRNTDDAEARINAADSKLMEVVGALQRARELTVRGATNMGERERDAIAEEIGQLRDTVVASANATYLGQGLFAGFQEGDAVAEVSGSWAYRGDGGKIVRRIGDTEEIAVNVTASSVLGFDDGDDVLTMLDELRRELSAGDQPAISARIDDLDGALQRVFNGLSTLGAAGNRVQTAQDRALTQESVLRTRQSQVEDVDLTEAVMELQTQEVALQATLGALSRAIQPSLVDFLR